MDKKKKSGNHQRGKKNTKNKSNLSDKVSRVVCDCEATKHPLVNNCLNCGRIVCLSEGAGPCFFCGREVSYESDPCFPLQPLKLTKESDNKQKQFVEQRCAATATTAAAAAAVPPDPTETLRLRDRLLEFDKNCASRTSVIDDESDYYQANNTWLSKSERDKWEKLASESHDKKHESRLLKKLTLDFTGRVQPADELDESPELLFDRMNAVGHDDRRFSDYDSDYPRPIRSAAEADPSAERPVYLGNDTYLYASNATGNGDDYGDDDDENNCNRVNNRVQDKGILEISDQGVCLSMHQPYASLLVRGIKKFEGRTWYSSHRGRLWIASAAKEPRPEEIKAVEDTYRLMSNKDLDFPKTYPTGCLIGCVTITDVLSREECQRLYPDAPAESPYMFVCEDFFELPMKYPIQGQHKIYKLESVIHRAALNCLEKTCKQMSKKARC